MPWLMRELGFQPLRRYQLWLPPAAVSTPRSGQSLPCGLQWKPVSGSTAQRLWPIEQGGSFSHLRQITDRHWLDLLDRACARQWCADGCRHRACRVGAGGGSCGNQRLLEILRDVAWDDRLNDALPFVLNQLTENAKPDGLLTALDDQPMQQPSGGGGLVARGRATADGSQHVAATAQQPSNRIESSNRRHARPAAPAANSSANTKPGATLTWVRPPNPVPC